MNIYRTLEDKWVYSHYNNIEDDEYCCFDISSSSGQDSISAIRISIRIMMISFLLTVALIDASYSVGFITAWIFLMSWFFKDGVEGKMTSGYPYLEHTDAIGLIFIGILSFIIMFVLMIVI